MATSTISYLDIISRVGFRRSAAHDGTNPPSIEGGFNAPRPLMTTTLTLEGLVQPDIEFGDILIIEVEPVEDFVLYPGGTSEYQTIKISNVGNVPVTVLNITSSTNNVTPLIRLDNSVNFPTIPAESTGTFELAYYGEKRGLFTNWILIESTVDTGSYKFFTNQVVDDILDFLIEPSEVNLQITNFNETRLVEITLIPRLNNVIDTSIVLDFTYSLTGSSTWSIYQVQTNKIILKFDSKVAANINNNYQATLLIDDVDIQLNANINIDYATNSNLGSWVSASGLSKAIVGISYDIINSIRTVTIGVGYIDDNETGINEFIEGAKQNISATNLGIGANFLIPPYTFWHTVYRIPLDITNPLIEYYSQNYVVKSQEFDYATYFGENQAPNSIFIVKSDQYGNIEILMNNLRIPVEFNENDLDISNQSLVTSTIKDLQDIYYAFYYYVPFRIDKLELPSYGNTKVFVGFNNNGTLRLNSVPIPPEP